jgi:Tol biopolymer transport system component
MGWSTIRLGALVALLLCGWSGVSAVVAQSPSAPLGRWRVVERGPGWVSPLRRLEFRGVSGTGDVVATAVRQAASQEERVWGSARLNRDRGNPDCLVSEWVDGSTTVLLQVRPLGRDRIEAVVRLKDRQRPWAAPERVGQSLLEVDPQPAPMPAPVERPPTRSSSSPSFVAPVRERIGLFVVRADGTGLRRVATPEGFVRAAHPSWSRDGRQLAFTAFDATGRNPLIRIVSAEGGPTYAVASGIAPTWSREGTRLAYIASGKAEYATDWDRPGRNDERIEAVRLAEPGAGQIEVLGGGLWPRWSPTDDRLAFVSRGASNWDIFVRSADGLNLIRLTDDPANDTYPVWTSDGRSIVFLSDRRNRWDLYRVSAEGQEPVSRVTNYQARELRADLSPDGTQIAYNETPGRSGGRIMLLDLATATSRPLLDPAGGDRDPAWSPDGSWIAFVAQR